MATNYDSFPITPAMLAMAWVKPAILYTPGGTVTGTLDPLRTNATDDYLPRTTPEKAGARGGPNAAVSTDPNYTFAITAEGPAVECNATLVLPQDPV